MTAKSSSAQTNSPASGNWNALAARTSIKGPLGLSLLAIVVTVVILLSGIASLVISAFGRGTGSVQPAQELDKLVAKHQEEVKGWQERFNGRSVFFKPPRPWTLKPKPEPREVVKEPPPPPQPPPPDPRYLGPSIAFAYGDTVYFSPLVVSDKEKYLRIRVGEEKSGVRVISTSLPYSVKLGHKGGTYDVPIFAKNDEDAFMSAAPKPVILTSFLIPVTPPESASAPVAPAPTPPADLAGTTAAPTRSERRGRTPAAPNPQPEPAEQPVQANQEETGDDDPSIEEDESGNPVVEDERPPDEEVDPEQEEPAPAPPQPSGEVEEVANIGTVGSADAAADQHAPGESAAPSTAAQK